MHKHLQSQLVRQVGCSVGGVVVDQDAGVDRVWNLVNGGCSVFSAL